MNYENKVKVGDIYLNVYTEGKGHTTIVFMSGNGVAAPALEYKPIYRRMSSKYRIAVIEKAGYGFSDHADKPPTMENLVASDREALRQAGIKPPYVLAPHSYSGLEAIYWANNYPDEVSAVLGIDMGVPELAVEQSQEMSEKKLEKCIVKKSKIMNFISKKDILGQLIKSRTEDSSGLMSGDELTSDEKYLYRKLYYQNIENKEFEEESHYLPENAEKASKCGELHCPSCFFISDKESYCKNLSWRLAGIKFAEKCRGEIHLSDEGHTMYAQIPDEMAETFDHFLVSNHIA